MASHRRLGLVGMVLLTAIVAVWVLVTVASAQISTQTVPSSSLFGSLILSTASDDPPPLGEPCGSGEQLPPWVLCLHGTVSLIQPSGAAIPLDGIPVTVTLGGHSITGTTFIHPGQVTPTYGVDISPLEPAFLQPITLTTAVSGSQVERQVVVFPDFRTQNQRFDVPVVAVGALDPAPVWGYVVDFGAGGPVTDARVTAERAGLSIAVTTTVGVSEPLPIYALSPANLAAIGATPGSLVTLTAH
jgi:hypothetical protein